MWWAYFFPYFGWSWFQIQNHNIFYQNLTGGEIDDDVSSVHSVLTEEERFRLREVIMTDERIQTILKETHTTERMMMLKDYRYIFVKNPLIQKIWIFPPNNNYLHFAMIWTENETMKELKVDSKKGFFLFNKSNEKIIIKRMAGTFELLEVLVKLYLSRN